MKKVIISSEISKQVCNITSLELCKKFKQACFDMIDHISETYETPEKHSQHAGYYGRSELRSTRGNALSLMEWEQVDGKSVLGIKLGGAYPSEVYKEVRNKLVDFILNLCDDKATFNKTTYTYRINTSDNAQVIFTAKPGTNWSYVGIVGILKDRGNGRRESIVYRNI